MLCTDASEPTCLLNFLYLVSVYSSYVPGEVELLGLSVSGQLRRITLPVGREDAKSSKAPSTQVGRSVRDLLSAIGDVCERYTQHDYFLIVNNTVDIYRS